MLLPLMYVFFFDDRNHISAEWEILLLTYFIVILNILFVFIILEVPLINVN